MKQKDRKKCRFSGRRWRMQRQSDLLLALLRAPEFSAEGTLISASTVPTVAKKRREKPLQLRDSPPTSQLTQTLRLAGGPRDLRQPLRGTCYARGLPLVWLVGAQRALQAGVVGHLSVETSTAVSCGQSKQAHYGTPSSSHLRSHCWLPERYSKQSIQWDKIFFCV